MLEGDMPVRVDQKIEHSFDFIRDALIRGEQALVGVEPSGGFIEVSGAYVWTFLANVAAPYCFSL